MCKGEKRQIPIKKGDTKMRRERGRERENDIKSALDNVRFKFRSANYEKENKVRKSGNRKREEEKNGKRGKTKK